VRLLLSYGVNDCEGMLAELALERVWRMLIPLDGGETCRVPLRPVGLQLTAVALLPLQV